MTGPIGGMQIDVRGPRFSAAVTFLVLALAVATRSTVLLGLQVAVFAVAALAGLRWSPYGNLFRFLKRRLEWNPPPATEPEAGPRFSQLMGLLFAGAGLAAVLAGAETLGWGLVLVVVALSGLLAATGLCVGCEIYAVGAQLLRREGHVRLVQDGLSAAEMDALAIPPGRWALVEFTSPRCGPCEQARVVLDDVAGRAGDGVSVVSVDVADRPELASAHRVLRAPTTLVIDPEGRVPARVTGVPQPEELLALLSTPVPAHPRR